MSADDIRAWAAALGAVASLGTLILAVVIYLLGRRTHDLVNSQSANLLRLTGDQAFAAGKTEGRISRLENDSGSPPPDTGGAGRG